MKQLFVLLLIITVTSCNLNPYNPMKKINQISLSNDKIKEYKFLECMYQDSYFPEFLVDKCKDVLLALCFNIENNKTNSLESLYVLSHAATEQINDLENEFDENDSEIETGARECLAINFEFVAIAYGFDADIEELIATRDW